MARVAYLSHGRIDRTWPSPTMEQPSWSCWKWSTQLPRSCVNWLTCRTRRSEMGPRLWWVGSTAAPLWCLSTCVLSRFKLYTEVKSECPVLVPCVCFLSRMCGYANRREKLSVSVWRGRAASFLPPLMKRWHNMKLYQVFSVKAWSQSQFLLIMHITWHPF